MRKYCCIPVLTCLGLTVSVASQSASAQVITQGFENVPGLTASGWSNINQSFPNPSTTAAWFQANTAAFVAQAGVPNSYAGSNFQSVSTGVGTNNTWLLTPAVSLVNGMVLKFWTRETTANPYPNRLQVRMSLAGASSNVGTVGMPDTFGDFSALLLDINPTLVSGVYPQVWTEQVITISGVATPTSGRLAVRFYVTGGGPGGANSNYIGVDTLTLSGPPTCTDPLPPCAGDVFPVVGGNGTVDIDDLVKVITTWGQDNTSSNGPRPDADCAPGLAGDCKVNIDDLVKVITSWGDCKGACCLANATCVGAQTPAQCSGAGGTYQGHDSLCANVVCVAGPVNDNCASRIVAINGNNAFNNANANTDGPAVATTCAPAPGGTRDVWFNYTATCTGHVTFDTLATPTPFTDTIIQVFNTNACPPGALLGCGDDVSTSNLLSSLTVDLTTGQKVKVRVMSWATSPTNQGPGVLNIACVPTNDDICTDATAITSLPATINGNITGATQDQAPLCNGTTAALGRWYTVVGNGTVMTACTCDSLLQSWDARVSVYCGVSCTQLFCVNASFSFDCGGAGSMVPGCSNPAASAGAGFHENVTWCAAAGQTYWILVASDQPPAAGEGAYTLKVSSGAACANPVQCIQPGDECIVPLGPLVVGNNALNNLLFTNSVAAATSCLSVTDFTKDGWYNFTPAATATFTFSMCGGVEPNFDSTMAIYSGPCNALVEVGCNDDFCGGGGKSQITAALTSGTLYKVRIGSWNNSAAGTYTLIISQGAPQGACCVQGVCTGVMAQAACTGFGSSWTVGTTCATACPPAVVCPPTPLPPATCTNQILGNGAPDGVNGTRPSIGWKLGEMGMIEDLVVCNVGGATINQIKSSFLDQITAGSGTLSTYNVIRVRIYNFNNQPIGLQNGCAAPIYSQDFTVGTNCTKALAGVAFGLDIETWTMTITPTVQLAQGTYGVWFSFPQVDGAVAPSVFMATGPTGAVPPGNPSSPGPVQVFGNGAALPADPCVSAVGTTGTQHHAVCVGGTVP